MVMSKLVVYEIGKEFGLLLAAFIHILLLCVSLSNILIKEHEGLCLGLEVDLFIASILSSP